MMFRTCGAAPQPPVRVASFPTIQVDDHLCPQSPRTYTTRRPRRNSGNSVALEPQRAKEFENLDGSNFADTLYQGDLSLERSVWKYRNTGARPSIPLASRWSIFSVGLLLCFPGYRCHHASRIYPTCAFEVAKSGEPVFGAVHPFFAIASRSSVILLQGDGCAGRARA
jgi:hypothetical protein